MISCVRLQTILAEDLTIEEAVVRCTRLLAVNDPRDRAIRRMLNIDIPLRWSRQEAQTVNRGVVFEIASWLRQRLDPVPEDLEARVFFVFGAVRGVMGLRLLEEAVAPRDEDLEARLVQLALWVLRDGMPLPEGPYAGPG